MGEVFLAYDTLLDRRVAVKFIRGVQPDAESRRQFLIEARAAARVQHPNVVSIYRVGELDGRPFIISEFVRGASLCSLDKPAPWERALEIGIGLSRGLAAAHRRGVLHRDIKPGNVILAEEGEVKILDFGLAKLMDLSGRPALPERGSSPGTTGATVVPLRPPAGRAARTPPSRASEGRTLTSATATQSGERPAGGGERAATLAAPAGRSGDFMGGTPHYIAPEIWRGEGATYRADVYSLGVVLFELCAGRLPFEDVPLHELPAVTARIDAPSLADASPLTDLRLAAVVDRCLRRNPAERFASGEELREALERINAEGRAAPIPEGNPYRGLLPFDAEHRALFFGRSNEIGTVLERLRTEPMVVVAGDSGVGKSSLCSAGVLPLVAEGALGDERRWMVRRFTPGRSPFSALAEALAGVLGADEEDMSAQLRCAPGTLGRAVRRELGDARGLVLCVDQLEELVTLADPGEAQVVAEALAQLGARLPGIRLLVTVRSDYLAKVAALPGLGNEITHALYLLRPLSPEKIREAIVGPARAKGVAFESEALVEDLVASTAQAEGLPLLQFALSELWEARAQPRSPITADALHAIGGVAGALARHADRVVLGLPEAERAAARRILMALVTLDETRAQHTEAELAAGDPASLRALEELVRGRLLVAHEGEEGAVYVIAHDALLRGWDTLRRWLDEQQEGRAARLRLEAAATEWARLGRAREALWGARQLEEVERVEPSELGPGARGFLETSRRSVRRRVLRRRALAVGLPLLALALYGAIRLNTQRDLDRRVSTRVKEAAALREEAAKRSAESDRLRQEAFAAFDAQALDDGERTWAKALELGARVDAVYGRAGQALETALLLDASRRDVRELLGDVLYERAMVAERERMLRHRDELLARMALHDPDGSRAARWGEPARIAVASSPPGATVTLRSYHADESGARRLGPARELGATPAAEIQLPPGSHLLTFTVAGRPEVRYPILVGRGEARRVFVDLPPRAAIPRGFVYVPAGKFLFGSSFDEVKRRSFLSTAPMHEVETGPYLIARHEVTWDEWIRFLRSLPPEERARRTPRLGEGAMSGGLALREQPDGNFQITFQPAEEAYTAAEGEPLTYGVRQRRARQDWQLFPVSGISLHDAEAYAAWLGATGRVPGARLCTEHEWERAARGADDRELPHGDALAPDDANFDETYGRDAAAMGPDEVGSHPASRSPFGLDDMAGNVFEWTTSSLDPGKSVARGGAYFYDRMTARSTNRNPLEPGLRDPRLGLRICAAAPGAIAQADAR